MSKILYREKHSYDGKVSKVFSISNRALSKSRTLDINMHNDTLLLGREKASYVQEDEAYFPIFEYIISDNSETPSPSDKSYCFTTLVSKEQMNSLSKKGVGNVKSQLETFSTSIFSNILDNEYLNDINGICSNSTGNYKELLNSEELLKTVKSIIQSDNKNILVKDILINGCIKQSEYSILENKSVCGDNNYENYYKAKRSVSFIKIKNNNLKIQILFSVNNLYANTYTGGDCTNIFFRILDNEEVDKLSTIPIFAVKGSSIVNNILCGNFSIDSNGILSSNNGGLLIKFPGYATSRLLQYTTDYLITTKNSDSDSDSYLDDEVNKKIMEAINNQGLNTSKKLNYNDLKPGHLYAIKHSKVETEYKLIIPVTTYNNKVRYETRQMFYGDRTKNESVISNNVLYNTQVVKREVLNSTTFFLTTSKLVVTSGSDSDDDDNEFINITYSSLIKDVKNTLVDNIYLYEELRNAISNDNKEKEYGSGYNFTLTAFGQSLRNDYNESYCYGIDLGKVAKEDDSLITNDKVNKFLQDTYMDIFEKDYQLFKDDLEFSRNILSGKEKSLKDNIVTRLLTKDGYQKYSGISEELFNYNNVRSIDANSSVNLVIPKFISNINLLNDTSVMFDKNSSNGLSEFGQKLIDMILLFSVIFDVKNFFQFGTISSKKKSDLAYTAYASNIIHNRLEEFLTGKLNLDSEPVFVDELKRKLTTLFEYIEDRKNNSSKETYSTSNYEYQPIKYKCKDDNWYYVLEADAIYGVRFVIALQFVLKFYQTKGWNDNITEYISDSVEKLFKLTCQGLAQTDLNVN